MEHPIDRAARIVGTQAVIARALNVTKAAVSQWKGPGGQVPAEHCPLIEEMTRGVVRCEDMRPDIRWDVLRGKRGKAAPKLRKQPILHPSADFTHA
ncbi:helix-turn-helix domain-containing protein [Delftia tsuruhatensis]